MELLWVVWHRWKTTSADWVGLAIVEWGSYSVSAAGTCWGFIDKLCPAGRAVASRLLLPPSRKLRTFFALVTCIPVGRLGGLHLMKPLEAELASACRVHLGEERRTGGFFVVLVELACLAWIENSWCSNFWWGMNPCYPSFLPKRTPFWETLLYRA